jgi:hypothetical protein
MNLTELRDVLDERSATDHSDFPGHRMLDGVHHRLRIRRRRRQIAAGSATALAVAAVGMGTLIVPDHQRGTSAVAPAQVRTIDGFPEYDSGHRVIATKTALPPAKSVTLTFTPTTVDGLSFLTRCEGDHPHALSLNGRPVSQGEQCSGFVTLPKAGKELHLAAGKPATLVLTFTEGAPTAEFGLAVGVPVNPAAYPYPPRPATLQPLELPADNPTAADPTVRAHVLRSDPADPQAPVTRTFAWTGADTTVHANTPGAIKVTINGTTVDTCRFWDYSLAACAVGGAPGARIRRGDTVVLTAVPDGMTGDWAVVIEDPFGEAD